ncbi:MAG: glucosaminidase domain-containing protein [Flavobacteriales bacterium]|nr:glucosaminidase domain-containing protein [Flavobacteriales bacterium]
MKQSVTYLLVFLFPLLALADGERISRSEYIDQWSEEAILQMVEYQIPASVTLAQGILESGDGNSELARKANNHFGIKCHSSWKGKKVYHDDDKKGECFRHYKNATESYHDHSEFLLQNRYKGLFDLKISDYKGWAKGLKKAGYATSPKYANLLINIIEKNDLTRFDDIGIDILEGNQTLADVPSPKQNPGSNNWDKNDGFDSVTLGGRREVLLSENKIKYTVAKSGDTPESIAAELEMMTWQIKKYNDLGKDERPSSGEIVYLQPKRSKARVDHHVKQEGESLRDISQRYGIKIKHIYRKNRLAPGSDVPAGTKLYLRKRIPRV